MVDYSRVLDPNMPYQYSRNPDLRPKMNVNILNLFARVSDCSVIWCWGQMLSKTRVEWSQLVRRTDFYIYNN